MNKNTIFWIVIVLLILVGIFGRDIFNNQTKSKPQSVSKTSENIPFVSGITTVKGFNYGFSPKTITVKQGDNVKLRLISDDSPHTFTIDELGVNQQFTYGKDADVVFTANKKGKFQYYCAVSGHKESGMVGTLIVE